MTYVGYIMMHKANKKKVWKYIYIYVCVCVFSFFIYNKTMMQTILSPNTFILHKIELHIFLHEKRQIQHMVYQALENWEEEWKWVLL